MLLWLALSAHSQPPPPPDAKEREAFFEVMREVLPHKELFDLLDHKSVRAELGLDDANAEAIEDNVRKTFEALRKFRDAEEGKLLTPEQLKEKVRETIAPFNQKSYDILEKNAKFDRLLGLYVQARGYRALLNDKIAKKIGLEGEALEEFRELRRETWRGLMEETNDAIKRHLRNTPPGAQPPRSAISDLFRHAEKKLEEKLSCSLSDEQKVAFDSLKGAKFDLPEHPFNYTGRGRGPGGSKDKGPGEGRSEKGSGERGPDKRGPDKRGPDKRGPDKRGPDGKPPHDRKAECEKCTDHHSGPASRISYSINSQLEIAIF